ncbi:hypothetical protein HDU82_008103 [Entophlyctis luteolus]|nr:hypothetical protein HDU82_008103 [Entophlyctis luteolus]
MNCYDKVEIEAGRSPCRLSKIDAFSEPQKPAASLVSHDKNYLQEKSITLVKYTSDTDAVRMALDGFRDRLTWHEQTTDFHFISTNGDGIGRSFDNSIRSLLNDDTLSPVMKKARTTFSTSAEHSMSPTHCSDQLLADNVFRLASPNSAVEQNCQLFHESVPANYAARNEEQVDYYRARHKNQDVDDYLEEGESYYGFVDNEVDALLLVEATISGTLRAFSGSAVDIARLRIRSGTVLVISESCRLVKRWKDGLQWSPSRAYGSFLLYRQTCNLSDAKANVNPSENRDRVPGATPFFAKNVLKPGMDILKEGGLTKRSITLKGSDDHLSSGDWSGLRPLMRPSLDVRINGCMRKAWFVALKKDCRCAHGIQAKKLQSVSTLARNDRSILVGEGDGPVVARALEENGDGCYPQWEDSLPTAASNLHIVHGQCTPHSVSNVPQ